MAKEVQAIAQSCDAELGPWVISNTPGNRAPCSPDWLSGAWTHARQRAGIDRRWRLHDLRHWAATTPIAQRRDIRLVAGGLGHARPATTLDVYAHHVRAADAETAEGLAAELKANE